MDINDLVLRETARMEVYKGLSACYYIPEMDLLTSLEKIERQLTFLGSEALVSAMLMRSALQRVRNIETLKCEFARLFIGPYHLPAPPYGSIYLDGKRKIMGASTVDAREQYHKSGLTLAKTFKDTPDHIAAELEFIYVTIFNEVQAIRSDHPETVCEQLAQQKSFLQTHLGAWVADFTACVKKNTKMDFFGHLADVTSLFIAEEITIMAGFEIPTLSESSQPNWI